MPPGPLIKYVVSEKCVDHMAHGDRQGGTGDVEGRHLQLSRALILAPLVWRLAGQLQSPQCSYHVGRTNHFRLAGEDALG